MAREYFNAYHSYLKAIEPLNDAERGRLFTACLQYSMTGEAPELRGNERFIFPSIVAQIDRDTKNYSNIVEERREAGKKGAETRWKMANDSKNSKCHFANGKNAYEKAKAKAKAKEKDTLTGIQREPEWVAFVEMRKSIKKPLTGRATTMALAKLEELAPGDIPAQKQILDQSTYHCWQGLFALNAGERASNRPGGRKPPTNAPSNDLDFLLED